MRYFLSAVHRMWVKLIHVNINCLCTVDIFSNRPPCGLLLQISTLHVQMFVGIKIKLQHVHIRRLRDERSEYM